MKIYVTGFHRAGTHSMAEYFAEKYKIPYIEEMKIGMHNLKKAIALSSIYSQGFVCQCPGLAHETDVLAKYGRVIWQKRNSLDIITSMKNGGLRNIAWPVMKEFNKKFPNDPIWKTITYDGSQDFYVDFIRYFATLKKVKDYFFEKYFKKCATVVYLENQPFYDKHKHLSGKKVLNTKDRITVERTLNYASICVGKAQRIS